eukprot:CAMPEP_0173406742 /NCGR_PEP_ID=MMETSP1356-20130122/65325_1 /TAXON_ID=77927 ORGANISM="Hemiselmis virescens, Strain PCC157" /NCGR_SAMPLE_ID=MMETSP1356 /ASSEMBLY_ACC=CAM_ASM_000847 /LENGTH=363 /DNA_ID=CAMNT_0014367777 /DNA_START=51 /DNA_END=1138 /DNA_ORIENTATION=+
MGRIPINSCDFSPASYSFDDNDGIPDPSLKHFDTKASVDVQNGMIPMILDALATIRASGGDELLLFGSPWSPPQWMKTNDHPMVGSDVPCIKDGMHQVWAEYILLWIKAYGSHGISIWGVTAQNEPGFVDNTAWEACSFTAAQQRDFIRDHLGPTLNGTDTNIIAFDDDKSALREWADTILSDPEAANFTWGMGLHWYFGDLTEHMSYVRESYPNAFMLATEGCTCVYDQKEYNDSWSRAQRYVHDAVNDLNTGVVGWVDWNLVLDISGPGGTGGPNHANNTCFAHIHVAPNNTLVLHKSYYTMGHLSRFLPRGSRVVRHSLIKGSVKGIEGVVALLPDGGVVGVFSNTDRGPDSEPKTLRFR